MKTSCFFFAAVFFVALQAGSAEVVKEDTRPLFVRYSSGDSERYVVKWTGSLESNHWEDGHPAIPLEGKFTDTRQCHWTINTQIVRKLFLINKVGEQFAKENLTTVLSLGSANQGSDFKLTQLRPENCGDAEARYQSDLKDARVAIGQAFNLVLEKDFQDLKTIVKGWKDAVYVGVEPEKR
jgi:hypothetical protein